MLKKLKIIIMYFIVFSAMLVAVNSAGLNVVLSSQNPDPVTPGNFVYLNVKVSNSALTDGNNVKLEFIENSYFKIAPGSDIKKELGTIPSYSSADTSANFVVGKFKVQVKENTPTGLNTVKFNLVSGSFSYDYEFDILVQDLNPNLIVSSFKLDSIKAGSNQKLTLEIENPNSINLKNVIVSLALDEVTPTAVLNTKSGSNQKTIPLINANEKVSLDFDLTSAPSSDSAPYLLPIDISYDDSLGNNFTKRILGSVKVFSEPILTVKLSSQDIFSKGVGKINLAIANPGTSTIKGTQIEILNTKDYEILDGSFEYIGNLNPDDFQTLQSKVYFNSNENFNIKVKVNYLDSYNNPIEKIIDVPVIIYSDEQLKTYGIDGASSGSSSTTKTITSLVLIILAFFIGRRLGYNKGKKKLKN